MVIFWLMMAFQIERKFRQVYQNAYITTLIA